MANFDLDTLSTGMITGATWQVPSKIQRTHANPLDQSTVHFSYEDAVNYALSGYTKTKDGKSAEFSNAYPGQFIAVVNSSGVSGYVINSDRTLKPIAVGGYVEDVIKKLNELSDSLLSTDGIIETLSDAIDTNAENIKTIQETTIPTLQSGLSVDVISKSTEGTDYAAIYAIKQGNTELSTTIKIPKDKVIESAYMVEVVGKPEGATKDTISAFTITYDTTVSTILSDDTVEGGGTVAEGTFSSIKNAYFGKEGGNGPYLRITVSHQDVPVYIAMPKLVDTYFGGETSSIKVEVNASTRTITANVLTNAISSDMIFDGAVITSKIKDGNVTTAKLDSKAVTTEKIDDSAVGEAQLSAGAVTTGKIADKAVTSDKIADDAITTGKIADGAVETADIQDGAVTHAKLASEAVESSNIKDSAVVESKINGGAVTTSKLGSEVVTTEKIASEAITESKISADAVTSNKIKDDSIITSKIANKNVTKAKLADDVLTWGGELSTQAYTEAKAYTDAEITKLSVADVYETKVDATAKLTEAKAYTDDLSNAVDTKLENEVTARNQAIEDKGTVLSGYVRDKIAELSVADVYETKVDATAKLTEAKSYTNTTVSNISTILKGDIEGLQTISANHEERLGTVETKVNNLSSALHFKGMATTDELSTGWTGTPIPPYKSGETPADGDIVIRIGDSREFVYGNGQWNELGAEKIWATDAALKAETERAKGIENTLRTDVNAISGWAVSSISINDLNFTVENNKASIQISCIDCGGAED